MKVHVRFSSLSNSYSFDFEPENEEERALLKKTKDGMYGKKFLATLYGYSEKEDGIKNVSVSFVTQQEEEKQKPAQKPYDGLLC